MANSGSDYYYTSDGHRVGPVDYATLRELAISGELRRSDMIWLPAGDGPNKAGELTDIFEGLPPDLENDTKREASIRTNDSRGDIDVVADKDSGPKRTSPQEALGITLVVAFIVVCAISTLIQYDAAKRKRDKIDTERSSQYWVLKAREKLAELTPVLASVTNHEAGVQARIDSMSGLERQLIKILKDLRWTLEAYPDSKAVIPIVNGSDTFRFGGTNYTYTALKDLVEKEYVGMVERYRKAMRDRCDSNLRRVWNAHSLYAMDHLDQYPFQRSLVDGGTRGFVEQDGWGNELNPAPHLKVLAENLDGPDDLVCPLDEKAVAAESFTELSNTNISYVLRTGTTLGPGNGRALAWCPLHHTVAALTVAESNVVTSIPKLSAADTRHIQNSINPKLKALPRPFNDYLSVGCVQIPDIMDRAEVVIREFVGGGFEELPETGKHADLRFIMRDVNTVDSSDLFEFIDLDQDFDLIVAEDAHFNAHGNEVVTLSRSRTERGSFWIIIPDHSSFIMTATSTNPFRPTAAVRWSIADPGTIQKLSVIQIHRLFLQGKMREAALYRVFDDGSVHRSRYFQAARRLNEQPRYVAEVVKTLAVQVLGSGFQTRNLGYTEPMIEDPLKYKSFDTFLVRLTGGSSDLSWSPFDSERPTISYQDARDCRQVQGLWLGYYDRANKKATDYKRGDYRAISEMRRMIASGAVDRIRYEKTVSFSLYELAPRKTGAGSYLLCPFFSPVGYVLTRQQFLDVAERHQFDAISYHLESGRVYVVDDFWTKDVNPE